MLSTQILYFLFLLDVASGSSADWTFEDANIFFSYAVELRDQGESGI
jgi:hypothetical protein